MAARGAHLPASAASAAAAAQAPGCGSGSMLAAGAEHGSRKHHTHQLNYTNLSKHKGGDTAHPHPIRSGCSFVHLSATFTITKHAKKPPSQKEKSKLEPGRRSRTDRTNKSNRTTPPQNTKRNIHKKRYSVVALTVT